VDTADPAPPVRWCALQAAPGQWARPFTRHERSTGPSVSGLSPLDGGGREAAPGVVHQSACLRRNAGISISSMPLELSASTLAAACVRPLRQTLGVLSAP
jgi:hypothetical protein